MYHVIAPLKISLLIAATSILDQDEPVHPHNLARDLAACTHLEGARAKIKPLDGLESYTCVLKKCL